MTPDPEPNGGRVWTLALIGFGTVAQAFVRLLAREHDRLLGDEGCDLRVIAVATRRSGAVQEPDGLDVQRLLRHAADGTVHGPIVDAVELAAATSADIVVETLPLDPHKGELAIAVTRAALGAGRSVVSANKGPVAHAFAELSTLAQLRRVHYRFESAVADGLPVFSLVEQTLPAARIERIVATLNSTTNVVLAAMLKGEDLDTGVSRAQRAGVAEADVTHDLDGWDAAVKLCALSAGVMGAPLRLAEVSRASVYDVTEQQIHDARTNGARLMNIGTLTLDRGRPVGSVRIMEVPPSGVFYSLTGTSLGIRFESSLVCPITVSSFEPTPPDTAYGLLADVLHIVRAAREDR